MHPLTRRTRPVLLLTALLVLLGGVAASQRGEARGGDLSVAVSAARQVRQGQDTFRYDTFGDEAFWGETLRLHDAIRGAALGGVGPGVSPATALAVGLKVDVRALPRDLRRALRRGEVDLDDPATTLALLQLDAVLGVTGRFEGDALVSMGIQCALCHSTVDDAFAPGIGRRLDGWANRDLDVGTIISLAPDLSAFTSLLGVDDATVREVLRAWGPGRFDASLLLDGRALGPDGEPAPVLIPPIHGLAGVNLHTWTGWGGVSHWNALVATLEMGGRGTFIDPRLDDVDRFPVAAANGFSEIRSDPDLVTSKLPALHLFQLALAPPKPPRDSYDAGSAERGAALFSGKADCTRCHVPPLYTEPGWNLHPAEDIGIDDFQASRSPEHGYRTAPLRGLWAHQKGGFYHDGRFATLLDVVDHYDGFFGLSLSAGEKDDLVEYLKSL